MLKHIQGQTFSESTRTDKKEETIRLLYQRDESGFIHVIIIVQTNVLEVHHTIKMCIRDRIIDDAIADDAPVSPKGKMIYLVALVLGVGIPVGVIYLLELTKFKIEGRCV